MPEYAALDRLQRALNPLPSAAVDGPHQLSVTGTVNIVGGGSGGTSMTDNSPFTPGSTSITPMGGYVGGRQIASGNAGAPALSASAIMLVDVRAGGAGGGIANLSVRGTANSDIHVGFASGANLQTDGGAALPITGTVAVGGISGSVNVTQGTLPLPISGTVNLGLGTVNIGNIPNVVVGSIASGSLNVLAGQAGAPWSMVGSVWIGGIGSDTANSAIRVNVVAGGAGGGVAQLQVVGTNNSTWLNVGQASGATDLFHAIPVWGTINTVGGGGSGFATAAVYGSPAFPVYNVGSVNVVNAVGIFGSTSVIGSVNITGSLNPVGVFGSMSVVGSVNSTIVAQPIVVDVRGSVVPTQWAIQLGASGPNVLFNAPGAGAIKLYGLTMIANATVSYRIQSPSGTDITGSVTLLPGAGVVEISPIRDPIYTGAATATWNLWLSSAVAVGGIARGWIE